MKTVIERILLEIIQISLCPSPQSRSFKYSTIKFNTYNLKVEVLPDHYVPWLQVAVAYFEIAVKVLQEDNELGGVCAHQFNGQAHVFRDEALKGPKRDVLHHKEQALLVLTKKHGPLARGLLIG